MRWKIILIKIIKFHQGSDLQEKQLQQHINHCNKQRL